MPLTFIGLRGSGKSTVGRLVAAQLERPFVDADDAIEAAAGQSIRDIFADGGEAQFRQIEQRVMADLLTQTRLVIAAGGGAVLHPDTRTRLRQSGPVVYLNIAPDTAAARMAGDATTATRRPALTALPAIDEMTAVLALREPLYQACATLTLAADTATADALASAVVRWVRMGAAS